MASQMSAPALDLSTKLERPFINIDKVPYDLRVVDDFTAVELRQLDQLMPRVVPLAAQLERGVATDAECEELSALLTALLKIVFTAPEAVQAKLGDVQKVKVFKVFIELLPDDLERLRAELGVTGARSRGMKLSPGSNGSTAVKSTRGRRKSH